MFTKTILYPISARCQTASACMRIRANAKKTTALPIFANLGLRFDIHCQY